MTKADSIKAPSKVETITLKVFIHCEGCKRKVSKIISGLDGVHSVTIDSDIGKVTVAGAVDAKSVLQKLEKAGKHAELWGGGGGSGASAKGMQIQGKPNNNNGNSNNSNNKSSKSNGNKENKKSKGGIAEEEQEEEGGGDEEGIDMEALSLDQGVGKGNSGKKGGKKGNGGGGNGSIEMSDFNFTPASNNNNNKNLSLANYRYVSTPLDPSQNNYSLQSAEYATQLFSDENANNCHIM